MRTTQPSRTVQILLLTWSTLCVSAFMVFTSRTTYVYGSNLRGIFSFSETLRQFDFIPFTLDILRSFTGMSIYAIACTSTGVLLMKNFKFQNGSRLPTKLSKIAYLSTSFVLGSGLFSSIFILMGAISQLSSQVIGAIVFVGLLAGSRELTHLLLDLRKDRDIPDDTAGKAILVLTLANLLLALALTSARISYDSTAIYFSDAKISALTHGIAFFTEDTFVASVFHSAVHFTAILQLFGDQAARMFSWFNGLIIIGLSVSLAEELGLAKRTQLILLAMLVTSTAFLELFGDGKVDLISTAPAIAVIYWTARQARDSAPSRMFFILIGILAGLAIILRPFNAFLVGVFLALHFLSQEFSRNGFHLATLKNFIQSMLWIGAGVFTLGAFHLIVNWLLLGSPFAFLSSITNINPSSGPWDNNPSEIFALRILYPLVVTFRNTAQSLGNISPLALAFVPMLFLADIRKEFHVQPLLKSMCLAAGITILAWISLFFTVVEIRYVFFLWIILFLPIAETLAMATRLKYGLLKHASLFLVSAMLVFMNFRTIYIAVDTYSPVNQQGDPVCRDYPLCDYLQTINLIAQPGERVLTLSAYRYYLRQDLFACSTSAQEYETLQKLSHQDPAAFWEEIYRQGYKYIAYEKEYTIRHLRFGIIPSPENTPLWLTITPINGIGSNAVIAYRIDVKDPPINETVTCQKDMGGIWKLAPAQ